MTDIIKLPRRKVASRKITRFINNLAKAHKLRKFKKLIWVGVLDDGTLLFNDTGFSGKNGRMLYKGVLSELLSLNESEEVDIPDEK